MLCLAAVILVACSGCAKKQETPKIETLEHLSCDFTAAYGGLDLAGRLELPVDGDPTVTVTAPAVLSGMTVAIAPDAVHIRHLGLSLDLPPEQFPQLAFGRILVDALRDALRAQGMTAEKTDTGFRLRGTIGAGDYTLELDALSRPVSLRVAAADFTCTFSLRE